MSRTAKTPPAAAPAPLVRTLAIHHAQPIGTQAIVPTTIVIGSAFPDNLSMEDGRALHARQALELAEALDATLPGGTLDRVVAEMVARHASLLRVPHARPKPTEAELIALLRWINTRGGLGIDVHEHITAALLAAEGRAS